MSDLLCDSRQESIVAAFVGVAHQKSNDDATEHFERMRPFYLLRPRLVIDGNAYGFILGETPQSVEGWGETADKASRAFDEEYMSRKIEKRQ